MFPQLFQQQFNTAIPYFSAAALTDTNYINATTPSSSQFTYLVSQGANMWIGGNGDTLTLFRNGSNSAYIARNVAFSGPPTAMSVKFDFNVVSTSGNSSSSPIHFYVGSSCTNSNSVADTTSSHSKFTICIRSSSGPKWFPWPTGTTSSYPSSGAVTYNSGRHTIMFVINNSGISLNYTAPTGSSESLANDCFDIWIDNTKEVNDFSSQRPNETLSTFKMYYGTSTTSKIQLDNFLIESLSGGSPPTTQANGINFGSISATGMTVNWTNGDGARRAVFVREGSQGTITNPTNGVTYSASTDWNNKGSQLGSSGYYCVYDGTGSTVALTNLLGGTTYWVQAFEYNGSGSSAVYLTSTATNNPNSQATSSAVVPTLTTTTVTSITPTTASSGGNITSDGGAAVTVRGVCWSTSANPTTADAFSSDGSGSGSFTSSITGLSPNTLYHVRAYATNSVGTAYGDDLQFTTSSLSVPVLTTTAISSITSTAASSGGNITSDGGASVTARGVCWNTSGTPTISDSYTSDGSGSGSFVSSLTSLTPGTVYYVRAYATNSQGTGYGSQLSFNTTATYYNVASSDISQPGNWGTNSDGSGYHPSDFTINDATYNITNSGAAISQAWSVSGTNSKIILGNGSSAISFTIPSAYTVNGTVDVTNNSTLFVQNLTTPTFGTVGPTSTIAFDGSDSLVIPAIQYGNLSSTNGTGGRRTLSTSDTIKVKGTFTVGSPTYYTTGSTLSFNGTSAQNLPAFTYNNLKLYNSAGCATLGNSTVNGTCLLVNNFTVSSGDSLKLKGSAPLSVGSGAVFTVNGTLDNQSTGTVTLTGTMNVSNGANYLVNAALTNSQYIPAATYASGSNIYILQGAPRINQATIGGNYIFSSTGSGTMLNVSNVTIQGDVTLNSGGPLNLGTGGTSRTLTIQGNLIVQGGWFDAAGYSTSSTSQTATINGDVTVSSGRLYASDNKTSGSAGTINIKGSIYHIGGQLGDTAGATNGTIVLNGTSAQSINSAVGGFTNSVKLNINNAAGVNLQSDIALDGQLILTKGTLDLGNYNFILASGATSTGGSDTAYVVTSGSGELRKQFNATGSFNFPLGDVTGAAEYSPILLALNSGAFTSAYVGAKVVNAKHPNNTSATDYINRYWQLTSSGISSMNADVKAKYVQADVAGTETNIYCGKWDGASWTGYDVTNATNDTLHAGGVTSFSDFTGGQSSVFGSAITVYLIAIPEGYYSTSPERLAMRDTFDVFLANATTPFAFVDTARIVIDSLTFDGSVRFNTAENGNYYLVIAGRNIVETWTASAQALTKGATANYSFISAQSQAYGNNLVLHGSKWCLYSGDVNQDEFVDFSDLGLVDNDSYNYMSGYLVTDINGDGFIDFTDLGMVDNNSYNYIGTAKPSVLSARPHQQRQRVPLK